MLPVIWLNEPASSPSWSLVVDVDPVCEVALPNALGAHEQLVDGAGDRAREREPHEERDALDDEKENRDHGERRQEKLPEIGTGDLHAL